MSSRPRAVIREIFAPKPEADENRDYGFLKLLGLLAILDDDKVHTQHNLRLKGPIKHHQTLTKYITFLLDIGFIEVSGARYWSKIVPKSIHYCINGHGKSFISFLRNVVQ